MSRKLRNVQRLGRRSSKQTNYYNPQISNYAYSNFPGSPYYSNIPSNFTTADYYTYDYEYEYRNVASPELITEIEPEPENTSVTQFSEDIHKVFCGCGDRESNSLFDNYAETLYRLGYRKVFKDYGNS